MSKNYILKYQEIYLDIKNKIDQQEWREEDVIPTERELAEIYETSRTTIRKTIELLKQDGYLFSQHGRGTFVLPEKSRLSKRSLHSFTDDISSRGGTPSQEILEIGFVPLSNTIRQNLQLSLHERTIFRIKRIRFSETTPMGIHTSYIPLPPNAPIEKEELLEYGSLYKLLKEKYNLFPLEAYESISARLASSSERSFLELDHEGVVLACTRITLSEALKPMEYVEMVYPASRYTYNMKINRDSFSRNK
ncbi:GntR family transcriptional regulator [Providencia hangzhouensis]|uniref:GntR family transcriptional regulator n=1 Tax=Providencia hangzhouensis TaxID=3031799 RepID=UPI0034DCD616